MTSISIKLNGETKTISDTPTLDLLLEHFSLPKQRVAIELNGNVVRRIDWAQTPVRDGDRIEVVHFVGGG
ncbi:MAG: sulfur carrier protein ThiS [Pyrinomonadaceae bacterium]|nr:sulfur carrier protein ThiS [Acidobacteriota bacterium]MBK7934417.1 sulfur carrier protein ThiS [Acidobacteriota bacterium]MBP7375680.1 sulfur carrier protein ThiS [Pyrinomonadaceae bacterium]